MLFSKSSLALALATTSVSLLLSSTLAVEDGVQRPMPRDGARRRAQAKSSKNSKSSNSPSSSQDPQTRSAKGITPFGLTQNDWIVLAPEDHQVSVMQQDFGGSVFIINGNVYAEGKEFSELSDDDVVGFYNQMCTVMKGTFASMNSNSINQNICEYNFCIPGNEKESCAFLRSGGTFKFTPADGNAEVPTVHAAILGGTGMYDTMGGSVTIDVVARADNSTVPDTSIFKIQFDSMLANSMFT